VTHPDVLVGTSTADDAGVFRLAPDLALVQTVDFFAPIVDDPFTFGQIAAANALSDVYAMGGEPRTALAIAAFPQSGVPLAVLGDILRGGIEKAREAGVVVLGGHTVVDDEIKYGLAVTGVVHPDRIRRNVGALPGDALVLTKPLGTGIVLAASMRGLARAREVSAALAVMDASNAPAAQVFARYGVRGCTDVTGFGLLGHLAEMLRASRASAEIELGRVPILLGAVDLVRRGVESSLVRHNESALRDFTVAVDRDDRVRVLIDPQTSGGLLAGVAAGLAEQCVAELRARGCAAAIVGRVVSDLPAGQGRIVG
jgi:selenide, water dikinase